MGKIAAIATLSLIAIATALPGAQNQSTINWHSCTELNKNITILNGRQGAPFDCAELSVPLDHTDPNSTSLQLNLFKVNATREPVLGSVLINFGGPGGTGAENLPRWAKQMAANIGEQWNLISWDPRGTGKTIPFDCKASITVTPSSKRKRDTELASANLTQYFLNSGWDYAEFVANICYAAMNSTGQYLGTPFVARDMIEIVDALGEDGLLRYYGWSYGTVLGSYVAAMFPDRVERIVLDANVNPHDYQSGDYGNYVIDADKAMNAFMDECLKNKPDCALAQYTNANSTQDMFDAINMILQPLAANASSSDTAWLVYQGAVQLIYQQLYYPYNWPSLAATITRVLNGTYNPTATAATNSTVEPYNLGTWALVGIRASDALWLTNSSAEYLPQVQFQETVSSFDHAWPRLWLSARWKMPCKEQYTGNFQTKTRHPILYVNGEYDPVAPLISAYNGSASFEGSVVLAHSGYGHGSVVDPSACVSHYTQAYFANGTLPANGTHCQPDLGPWELAKALAGASGSNATSTAGEQGSSAKASTSVASQGSTSIGSIVMLVLSVVGIVTL